MHHDRAPSNGDATANGVHSSLGAEESALVVQGLLLMLAWSVRCGFNSLLERVARCVMELPLMSLTTTTARDPDGNSVLHVFTFAGQERWQHNAPRSCIRQPHA